jgi:serine protease AprX
VTKQVRLIRGFTARVPASAVAKLRGTRGVKAVTVDSELRSVYIDGWDNAVDSGSTFNVAEQIGARGYWRAGFTGKGVDVAVIDSGVSSVPGLDAPGQVVHGPDLSFESQDDALRYTDTFGHGTHMAGIIAGKDPGVLFATREARQSQIDNYVGVAPEARIVSLKVANRQGAVDVSQIIAAIDWVVQHRNSDGLNIRVLNLSYGTDGVQDYRLDPLTHAVEAAWRNGIVVVVSGGNAGFGSAKLNNPAYSPHVIAVGAVDTKGTIARDDDSVPSFSNAGDGVRNPDLLAPGKSIVSLRSPGSTVDLANAGGRVGASRFFRGSGTSQSAAVVSGAAALIIQERPTITPDQLKALLISGAWGLPAAANGAQVAPELDLRFLRRMATPVTVTQQSEPSTGLGSLDAARGTQRLVDSAGSVLAGEIDIFGQLWDPATWSLKSLSASTWNAGAWNGQTWTGSGWNASGWSGSGWSGSGWSGRGWAGSGWSGSGWSGSGWNGSGWSGSGWG